MTAQIIDGKLIAQQVRDEVLHHPNPRRRGTDDDCHADEEHTSRG